MNKVTKISDRRGYEIRTIRFDQLKRTVAFAEQQAVLFGNVAANLMRNVWAHAICAKYGQNFNTGSFTKQYGEVLKRIFRYSLPDSWFKNPIPALPL
jgi:hypothetical protein